MVALFATIYYGYLVLSWLYYNWKLFKAMLHEQEERNPRHQVRRVPLAPARVVAPAVIDEPQPAANNVNIVVNDAPLVAAPNSTDNTVGTRQRTTRSN